MGLCLFSSFKVNAYSNVHVELFSADRRRACNYSLEKSCLYQKLEKKLSEIKTLDSLTEKINAGLTLEEVLNYVFESF